MQLSHAFSRFSVCSSDFFAQYSMSPYVYPFGYSAGPCRRRTDFGTTYDQSCRQLWGKYRACRTHVWEPFGPRTTLLRQNRRKPISERYTCSSFSHGLDGAVRIQNMEKSYKLVARSSAQSYQCFRYALNWQTRTQSFFIRTAESNQTELGAHAISVLSCTG